MNFSKEAIETLANQMLKDKHTLNGILKYEIKDKNNNPRHMESEYSYSNNNNNHFFFVRTNKKGEWTASDDDSLEEVINTLNLELN